MVQRIINKFLEKKTVTLVLLYFVAIPVQKKMQRLSIL